MNGRSIGIAALFLRISTTKIQAYTNVCPHQSVNNRWSLEGNSFKCAQHGNSYGTDCDASDQGFFLGEHGFFDKRFIYEESLRMPFVIRYPGKIKPGIIIDDIISNIDFAPTLLDMAGVPVPEGIQGKSFFSNLQGETSKDWKQSMYYHYYEYPFYHRVQPHYGIRNQRYILIHFYYDIYVWELYDLENDPNEMNNLIADKAYTNTIRELKSELYRLKETAGNTMSLQELRTITEKDFGGLE